MHDRLSRDAREFLHRARGEARQSGHPAVGTGHLLLAILDDPKWGDRATEILEVDPEKLRTEIERLLPRERSPHPGGDVELSPRAERCIENAGRCADDLIHVEHVLQALLVDQAGPACRAVVAAGGRPRFALLRLIEGQAMERNRWRSAAISSPPPPLSLPPEEFRTQSCCTDLDTDDLGPVVGRKAEIARLKNVLARRRRGNALIIGEPGVGKTAVVRGLLDGTTAVWELDIPFLIAGTEYRGDLESRIIGLVGAAWEEDRTLYIEDLHILTNDVLGEDAESARFCLRRFLDDSGVLIGSVSPAGFRALREEDAAFVSCFQPVFVAPATVEETRVIVSALRARYLPGGLADDLVPVLVELAALYFPDRALPGSAVDLLDDVGVAGRKEKIDEEALVRLTAAATGISEETIRRRAPGRSPWREEH